MDLSVVVPTLDGRERLRRCLESLSAHVPDAEIVVVNGPSTDGTSGMVRDRSDVGVLVEVADRNRNVARNAGIGAASGDVIALVGHDLAIGPGWVDAIREEVAAGADVVTGPIHQAVRVGMTTESEESEPVAGRTVTYFNGDNVAFSRAAIQELDGFDEYLEIGGAHDGSHRLAALGRDVVWSGDMVVTRDVGTDGGVTSRDWTERYRALAYRLTKNYGIRPGVARRLLGSAVAECAGSAREVATGELPFSSWLGAVRGTIVGAAVGARDGVRARFGDRATRHNPHGISSRYDRAVETYDRR